MALYNIPYIGRDTQPPLNTNTKHTQVDPLRSLAKNRPEFGAYRVYPPEYTAPANQVCGGSLRAWCVVQWIVLFCSYLHTYVPADHTPIHPSMQVPDGKSVVDDTARVERWGSCWNR